MGRLLLSNLKGISEIRFSKLIRRLSIRHQIFIILIGLALITSGTIGWISFRTSYNLLEKEAIRTVGMAAESRLGALRTFLRNRSQRAKLALSVLINTCEGRNHLARHQCERNVISQFLDILNARGAYLKSHGELIQFGPEVVLPVSDLDFKPPVLARIFRNEQGHRYFLVGAFDDKNDTGLILQFGMGDIDRIFLDRYGLGQSGESFLVDSKGFFLTPARYHSTEGRAHPINSRTMATCLSGQNSETLGPDYRNAEIIHGFRYVPEIGGGCAEAHLDQAEAFAPARQLGKHILLIAIFMLALACVIAVILSGMISRPIQALLDKLTAAVQARDEFMSICSHELKTPLSGLKLRMALTRKRMLLDPTSACARQEVENLVGTLDRQIEQLTRLVDDTLDVSRIARGSLSIFPEQADLFMIVSEAAERMRPQMALADCALSIEKSEPVPGCWDRSRIEQVVINLLSNAMKYGRGKPVRVHVEANPRTARILVKDQGIGIAPEEQSRIFKRFERLVSGKNISGLGIGLFIAQHIVEAHHGSIQVKSRLNEGATFIVELPRDLDEAQLSLCSSAASAEVSDPRRNLIRPQAGERAPEAPRIPASSPGRIAHLSHPSN